MEPARIRTFLWHDLEPFTHLFNEVNQISDNERAYDLELMRQFLSQPSCQPEDHCFVAISDDSLLGYVIVSLELAIGRGVASGGVSTEHRRNGIGRTLVKTASEHARASGAGMLHIQASSDSGAARNLLESEGFSPVKTYLEMTWNANVAPPVELPDGFSIRSFVPGRDEEVLTRLQNEVFGESWGFSPNTVEEIRAKTRLKRSEPEGIIFLVDGSRPVAYNWTQRASTEAGSTGWIAMTGVRSEQRGRGLGTAVVRAGLGFLVEKGVDVVELEVDEENTPARELYLGLGFEVVRESVWYEKPLRS